MNLSQWNAIWLGLVLVALSVTGCEEPADTGASEMDKLAAQLEQSKQAPAVEPAAPVEQPPAPPAAEQPVTQAVEQPAEQPAAAAEGGGYYSAIVGAHRHITTRVDDLAWKQAIQHYKATNGEMPKDHAEFMSAVIEGFGIALPPLEEGEEYLWVPDEGELGELYVVRQNP